MNWKSQFMDIWGDLKKATAIFWQKIIISSQYYLITISFYHNVAWQNRSCEVKLIKLFSSITDSTNARHTTPFHGSESGKPSSSSSPASSGAASPPFVDPELTSAPSQFSVYSSGKTLGRIRKFRIPGKIQVHYGITWHYFFKGEMIFFHPNIF